VVSDISGARVGDGGALDSQLALEGGAVFVVEASDGASWDVVRMELEVEKEAPLVCRW